MKLWDKGAPLNKQIEAYTVGNDYLLDQKLVRYDCIASIAHAKMLGEIGILSEDEVRNLEKSLNEIIELDKNGRFKIQPEQEDCHTAIELYLTEKLGETGKKIHTARSRNDQVLTALRLFYKEEISQTKILIDDFLKSVSAFIKKYPNVQFPGYTHTRKAMPSSIQLWGEAFVESMQDNLQLLDAVTKLIDQSPLGTAAGYGVPLAIDRDFTRDLLGFAKLQNNPIYAQLSRGKFEASILHVLSQIMFDFNRIASDLILFSLPQIGYFELPEDFCTGSSIMPQKKNPDVLELVRANYHTVLANEVQLKTLTANLISGYHRDLQLSKEPVMKSLEITNATLGIMALLFQNLVVNEKKCHDALSAELYATEEVYKLVKKGMSFREAYKKIAKKF